MLSVKDFEKRIFTLSSNNADFQDLAFTLFLDQYERNRLYKNFVDTLGIAPGQINDLSEIPFLPIQFFKTHQVMTGDWEPELVFESSGTTQTINSHHYVKDANIYEQSFMAAFEQFYGPVSNYVVLGLLPSYLERKQSSLVSMVSSLIRLSGRRESGFYLYEHETLYQQIQELEARQQPILLIGVTFALLDFAEQYPLQLQHTVVMETGGMKGRREEQTRPEIHAFLKKRLGVPEIHSEYGMTELLSQAYARHDGFFECPPWMKILLRDENDPFHVFEHPGNTNAVRSGIMNIIDLANIHSCAFIATEDVGKLHSDGRFEVLGRMDNSALRGCSLMI